MTWTVIFFLTDQFQRIHRSKLKTTRNKHISTTARPRLNSREQPEFERSLKRVGKGASEFALPKGGNDESNGGTGGETGRSWPSSAESPCASSATEQQPPEKECERFSEKGFNLAKFICSTVLLFNFLMDFQVPVRVPEHLRSSSGASGPFPFVPRLRK